MLPPALSADREKPDPKAAPARFAVPNPDGRRKAIAMLEAVRSRSHGKPKQNLRQ
jgi:hypothetical protein